MARPGTSQATFLDRDLVTLHIPAAVEDPDLSVANAARAYSDAGWLVVPVARGTKHPGSLLGQGWHQQSACDTATITAWWEKWPDAGVALHVGRSGAVALDVDDPSRTPDVLDHALMTSDTPLQRTHTQIVGKGHYLFTMPATPVGNSTGSLGIGWGDVRGHNGIIMAAPSVHPNKADGGEYWWVRTGPLSPLPEGIADALPAAPTNTTPPAEPSDVATFLDTHTAANRPGALDALVTMFTARVSDGDSRHVRMSSTLLGAMREARAGHYPARTAEQRLRDAFLTATTKPGASQRTPDAAHAEFDALLAWAIAQASSREAPSVKPPEKPRPSPSREVPSPQFHSWENGGGSTWLPTDLGPALRGERSSKPPTIGYRTDGVGIFYAGETNMVVGESDSGKSWFVQKVCAQLVTDRRHVVYVDVESSDTVVVERLLTLGALPEHIAEHFHYISPDEPLAPTARADFEAVLADVKPALVVGDAVTGLMAQQGLDINKSTDVEAFFSIFVRLPTQLSGAGVVVIDHKSKPSVSGGARGPTGSQHKKSAVSGVLYEVKTVAHFSRNNSGKFVVTVSKDRPGYIREKGNDHALCYVDVKAGQSTRIRIEPPAASHVKGENLPTTVMEKVSQFLAAQTTPATHTAIREGVGGSREVVRKAVGALADFGYAVERPSGKRGGGRGWVLVTPYVENESPLTKDQSLSELDLTRPELDRRSGYELDLTRPELDRRPGYELDLTRPELDRRPSSNLTANSTCNLAVPLKGDGQGYRSVFESFEERNADRSGYEVYQASSQRTNGGRTRDGPDAETDQSAHDQTTDDSPPREDHHANPIRDRPPTPENHR